MQNSKPTYFQTKSCNRDLEQPQNNGKLSIMCRINVQRISRVEKVITLKADIS